PAGVTVQCSADVPAPDITVVIDEADNDGVPTVTFVSDASDGNTCPEVITRTYSVTDNCGNAINVTQTITVDDNIPPSANINGTIFLLDGPIPPVDLSVVTNINDNCTDQPIVSFVSETISGSCPTIINRIYRVVDDCQNEILLNQIISIENYNNNVNASFSMTPNPINSVNSTVNFLNNSTNANSYQWFFGDGLSSTQFEPLHSFDSENCFGFTITLVASDGNCTDTIQQYLTCDNETIFYVPNTFTPDGDNFNQTFFPVFHSGFDPLNFEMLIFDRWGELIFETHNVNYGWDGTDGKLGRKLQDGVYTWKIMFKSPYNDFKQVVVGHVNLLR
ncbi:MAG: gliding motility-associated C-terminal domain-containing protein, partial [Crocinitomicaceae bacterium]